MAPPSAQEAIPISDELARFLENGHIADAATRTDDLQPECMNVSAMTVEADKGLVSLYLPQMQAGPTLANLRSNGQIAVDVSRPSDHRTLQLKGVFVDERPAREDERPLVSAYLDKLVRQLGLLGVPLSICLRLVWWPSQVVRFSVRDIFEQTPGPGAGRRLGTPAPPP